MLISYNLNDTTLRTIADNILKFTIDSTLTTQEVINNITQTLQEIRDHAYETGYNHSTRNKNNFKY